MRSDETAITSKDTAQGQEGLLGHGLHADPAGQGPAADRAREHRRVPELQPVRGPAALQAGRRGHHGRRDPQGLRRAAARQAQGRRRAVLDRALRHRAQPATTPPCATRSTTSWRPPRPTARGSRSTTRRSASPARRPTRRRCSGTSHIRCGVGRDTATHPACCDRSGHDAHPDSVADPAEDSHECPARQPGPLRVGLRRHRGAVPGRRRRLDRRRHAARRDAGQPRPDPAGLRRGLRQHRPQHPADAGLLLLRLRLPAPGDRRPVVLRAGLRRADHLHVGIRLRGRALRA